MQVHLHVPVKSKDSTIEILKNNGVESVRCMASKVAVIFTLECDMEQYTYLKLIYNDKLWLRDTLPPWLDEPPYKVL